MRTFLLLLAATAGSLSLYAQQTSRGNVAPTNLEFISQQLENGKGVRMVDGARGTPYLAPNWTQGRVRMVGGNTVAPVWLKYNLVSNQLLWRRAVGDSPDRADGARLVQ